MKQGVSVIVCAYNAEKTIGHTLDSLFAQTLKDIEIIVINDGSTDDTQDILDELKTEHPNLKCYKKENAGIAAARNTALTKIETSYFGFLDADDTCEPEMFERLYQKAIEENSDMVVSHFWWVNSKGRTEQVEGPYKLGREMMVSLFATLWNKLYKTETILNSDVRFPDGNRYEDACFLYCLASQIKKISFVPKPFVNYMQQENSITHTNNAQVKNMITVFQIILEYYRSHGLYKTYHDELEYIHVKFFLGNSFLRSSKIQDKEDRRATIQLGWNLLNKEFPNWHQNHYLKELPGLKNRYFRMVNDSNIYFFAWIFRHFDRGNL